MPGKPSTGSRKGGRHRRKQQRHKMSNKGDGEGEEEEEEEELYMKNTMISDDTIELVGKSEHAYKSRKRRKHQMTEVEESASESVWLTTIQVFVPFLVAGLGMVGAGLVLDVVQHWDVYQRVSEVFILVPALLGLKGNLEMTLASRLSTQANLGYMDSRREQWKLIAGNMALIQCQAIVVGSLAAVAAVVMGWIPDGEFNFDHALLLCASSMLTASLASFVLGMIMVAVIMFSRWLNINPDNVATPIAASLGDLTTLAVLSWIASMLFEAIGQNHWLAPAVITGCLGLTPVWGYIAASNRFTKEVLSSGWTPVISSMVISSAGGLILDFTVSNFKGIAVFQPVINGVGGNLVAVQASRISTSLHQRGHPGYFPPGSPRLCLSPSSAFCSSDSHSRTARVLLGMVIPGHLIFSYTISYLHAGHTSFTAIFMLVYLAAALLQVLLLLYIAHVMTLWMWKQGIDPDNSAIPYLTAIGDLLGTGLLALAFQFLFLIGDGDSDVGE